MALSDHEARAMAVKMLDMDELKHVHTVEEKRGVYLLPYEIARYARRATMGGSSIRKWWGVPENPAAQRSHADRLKEEIRALMRQKDCHVDMGDAESRANFDWHIFHSLIDFAYNGMRITSTEPPESIMDVPKRDGKTEAVGS